MEPDFFTDLPLELITNILSRLFVRSIAISKCVCRSWLDALNSDDFADSHFSKSGPALAVLMPARIQIIDLRKRHRRRHTPLINSNFPHRASITGAADGLLLLTSFPETIYVCNPIARQYAELCNPPPSQFGTPAMYGFGATKCKKYKVVRITPESDCHVYTLGTEEMWRRVESETSFKYKYGGRSFGAFLNGNLHWMVLSDSDGRPWISCFDVETERFSTLSAPASYGSLSCLRDCLCLFDNRWYNGPAIWMMKEYGVEKSWTKEYVLRASPCFGCSYEFVYAIKVFKNGDILMLRDLEFLFYYSSEKKSSYELGAIHRGGEDEYINAILVTPTFRTLQTLGIENVTSF
ncbi:F-box protein CPR1-like [Salvia divinorum]|uniref:F-box protein CPR1-like n=1 Tax=Salvia divinorum TaxID=28513 RepID=A0ABD1I629_SALDI